MPNETKERPPRILIVDDERLNINILYDTLQDRYQIKVALNGLQALERAASPSRPDIILLDVVMPGMDGFEVCRRLKADPETADIPVIFITAKSSEADEVRGLEMGGADFLSKPIRPAIVRARVNCHVTRLLQKRQLQEMHERVLALSLIDGLTGIPNRRRFDEFLGQEWARSMRSGNSLGLLMMDIDHFKRYNDHYGHSCGDACLKRVAEVLAAQLRRPPDLLARYGGEEFACLLPDTDLNGIRNVANTFLEGIRAAEIPHARSPVERVITLSIGGTAMVPAQRTSALQLIDRADALLYRTKNNGRNGMTIAGA